MPWMKRKAIMEAAPQANRQAMSMLTNKRMVKSSTLRRPMRSASQPKNTAPMSCPR